MHSIESTKQPLKHGWNKGIGARLATANFRTSSTFSTQSPKTFFTQWCIGRAPQTLTRVWNSIGRLVLMWHNGSTNSTNSRNYISLYPVAILSTATSTFHCETYIRNPLYRLPVDENHDQQYRTNCLFFLFKVNTYTCHLLGIRSRVRCVSFEFANNNLCGQTAHFVPKIRTTKCVAHS